MNEVTEHEVLNQAASVAAMRSVMVMEQWANGEVYSEERWIERARFAEQKTLEGMFELGRALIILKEHTEHGRFRDITENELSIHHREAARMMAATRRFATPSMHKVQNKLMNLGKSKMLELLVEEDVTLIELADGGDINGNTLDDVDRMTIRELRVALRESRETAEAKDKVIFDKNKKVDELAEKLAKKQVKEPKPQDVASELTMTLSSMTVNVRSGISRFSELFEQLSAHGEAHGFDHRPQMVAALNQLILDCEILRERFALPEQAPDDSVPEWLKGEGE